MINTVTVSYDDLDEKQKASRENFNSSDQWVNDHFKSQFGQNNKKDQPEALFFQTALKQILLGVFITTIRYSIRAEFGRGKTTRTDKGITIFATFTSLLNRQSRY